MHEWRLAPLAGDAAILLALAGDDSRSMRKARKAKNKTVHAVRVRPILPSLSFITREGDWRPSPRRCFAMLQLSCSFPSLLPPYCAPSQFSTLEMSNMQPRARLVDRKLSEGTVVQSSVNHRFVSDLVDIARGHELLKRDKCLLYVARFTFCPARKYRRRAFCRLLNRRRIGGWGKKSGPR